MKRLPLLALAVYVPHLLEEHLAGMADDPLIVAAFRPFESLPGRTAGYAIFQLTLVLGIAMTALAALGNRARALVVGGLGLALLAESHHLVRALAALEWNPGLATSAPMPVVGFFLLRAALGTGRPALAVSHVRKGAPSC